MKFLWVMFFVALAGFSAKLNAGELEEGKEYQRLAFMCYDFILSPSENHRNLVRDGYTGTKRGAEITYKAPGSTSNALGTGGIWVILDETGKSCRVFANVLRYGTANSIYKNLSARLAEGQYKISRKRVGLRRETVYEKGDIEFAFSADHKEGLTKIIFLIP